jgi:hypothetical protein
MIHRPVNKVVGVFVRFGAASSGTKLKHNGQFVSSSLFGYDRENDSVYLEYHKIVQVRSMEFEDF